MQRSLTGRARLLVVAVGGVALLLSATATAQTTAGKTQKSTAKTAQPTVAPIVALNDAFNQQVVIDSLKKKQPGELQDTYTTLTEFNFRVTLSQAWNANRAKIAEAVRQYMAKTLNLYDNSVNIAVANAQPKAGGPEKAIFMYVDPKTQTLTVKYHVPGHSMSGSLSVPWWFDPTLSGKFDLELVMFFDTKGPASNPLVLKSTSLHVTNYVTPILDISVSGEATIFGKATVTDPGAAKQVVRDVNVLLGYHTAKTGFGVVRPGARIINGIPHLVLELSKTAPVLSPK